MPLARRKTAPDARPEHEELDLHVIRAAALGDEEAFRRLVARYEGAVVDLVWRMLARSGRGDLVEDLAQETFLRVFRKLGRYDPERARPSTWILTIATRLSLDALRRRPPPAAIDPDVLVSPAQSAEGRAADRELARRVLEVVDGLDPEQRAVLVLREYHDLTYEEIAEALAIPVGTVRSRLSRARNALRDALGGER